jgi:hypothetical protein
MIGGIESAQGLARCERGEARKRDDRPAPAIGVSALPGTKKERDRSGVVCTAVGLMEGFEGDRGGQHERDDDGGDPDEGLLAVHPGFHGGDGRMPRAAQAVPTGTVARYRYQ